MAFTRNVFAAATLLAAFAAQAQDGAPPAGPGGDPAQRAARMAERFKAADTDHDGKLTKAEAEAGMPMLARNWDKIDTQKTGSVTLEQLTAVMSQMRGMGGPRGQGGERAQQQQQQ